MRKLIFSKKETVRNPIAYSFALFPTVVQEDHPTESRKWLIWLEWYETDERFDGK